MLMLPADTDMVPFVTVPACAEECAALAYFLQHVDAY